MPEISKAYEPQTVEDKWYQFWLDQKCFVADPQSSKPPYSIVIPPPNVTGVLHMGHVLNNTIQDILSRKARMDGKEVLWLPGTDHAGIATQAVVEKALRKQGVMKHREDIGREKFLEHVWAWKEKHGGIIIQQLKKLGCSCDWSRERFTMDPEYSKCVQKVFVELYKKGLIYRGKRMVNWDPAACTALSDEEVEMIETKGHLWNLKYPMLNAAGQPIPDQFVIVATTRPETMLGDEAVAVNPKDERYTKLVGSKVLLPLQNKHIPIIADDFVDPKFGTGCVKVTPAHDPNDYAMAMRHNLPLTVVIGPDGKMTNEAGGDFAGLDRAEARKSVVEHLEKRGLLLKVEDYVHNVGHSQRSGVPIEPYLSEQWFLKYPSVEKASTCVQGSARVSRADSGVSPESSGSEEVSGGTPDTAPGTGALPGMQFHPDRWTKTYSHWMGNLRDWCISRQLWWGHRVPVWRKRMTLTQGNCGELLHWGFDMYVSGEAEKLNKQVNGIGMAIRFVRISDGKAFDPQQTNFCPLAKELEGEYDIFYVGENIHEYSNGKRTYINPNSLLNYGFTQDPDVLDTWFSSWLWPFATMGWTGDKAQDTNNPTLQKFYPTTDLVTAPEIIFFWVARMIMAGFEYMGDLPFRNVYFTGIIRDKLGRKMSKSLGNSPDPLDLIAKFGADAVRFGTMRSAPLGQDVMFDEKDVELGRNFCNKLWNACRFRQMQGGESEGEIVPALLSSDDKWILLRLDTAIHEVSDALNSYKFNEAASVLYRFFWSEYCDWYVEACKAVLSVEKLKGEKVEGLKGENFEEASVSTVQPFNHFNDSTNPARANTLAVIDFILSNSLRLFHPFLPFITEELWQGMGFNQDLPENQGGKTIMFANWPKPLDEDFKAHYCLDSQTAEFCEYKYELVRQGRNLKREANIQAAKKVNYVLKPAAPLPPYEAEVLKLLLNAQDFTLNADYQPGKGTPSARSPLGELYLPLEGMVDVAAEKARLTKELGKIQVEVDKIQQKLSNPNFTEKVPPPVLEEQKRRLVEWQGKKAKAEEALTMLG